MPGVFGWGWDSVNEVWRPIKVSATGALYIVETVDALNDIGDVDVAAPTDDFFLYWDDPASKWKARALVAGDIPNLDAAKITSGTFAVVRGGTGLAAIAQGGILYASAPNTLARLAPGAANRVLRSTAANALQFAALLAADIPNLNAAKITAGVLALARIPAHKNTHDPEDGSDPLDSGAPSDIGVANAEGAAHALARQGHVHDIAGQAGEGHIFILPLSYVSIGQGTWITAISAGIFFAAQFYSSDVANGDNISYQVYLAKGTYTLMFLCRQGPNMPIVDFDIDAGEVASFDLYHVNDTSENRRTQTAIGVATSGLKTLKLRVDGKHASSGGYWCFFQCIILWRTA